MKTDYPAYRIGEQQRETLRKLFDSLGEDATDLNNLIQAAIGADVPAQALADTVGISYSSLSAWIKDGQMNTARESVLPNVRRVTSALGLGVAVGLLPINGDQVAAALAILDKLMEIRDERDEARAEIARLRAAAAPGGKSPASNATIDSYSNEEE